MKEVILKNDVLQLIQQERWRVHDNDEYSLEVKKEVDDILFRVYHKIQVCRMK